MRTDLIPPRTLVQAAEARRRFHTCLAYHARRALPTALIVLALLAFGGLQHQKHLAALAQVERERDAARQEARENERQVQALRVQVPPTIWGCSGVSARECADRLQITAHVLNDTARQMRNAR